MRWTFPSMEGCFRHRLSETSMQSDRAQCPPTCKLQGLCQPRLYPLPISPHTHSFSHSFTYSFTHSCTHSLLHFFIHSSLHSITHSLIYTHSYICLHTHSVWGLRSCASLEQVHPWVGRCALSSRSFSMPGLSASVPGDV